MKKPSKPIIYTIVVTYNRLNLLKKCLSSIKNQTFPVKKIIVVDNFSTDGTRDYLKNLIKKDKKFQVIFNKDNLGMANAINLALMTIQAEDWDYVWITDDDSVADKKCLEELISNRETGDILSPIFLDIEEKNKIVFPFLDFEKKRVIKSPDEIDKKIIRGGNPFNFTLVRKDKMSFLCEDYFIRGEEIDFFLTKSFEDTRLVFVKTAKAYSLKRVNYREINFFGIKVVREEVDVKKFYYIVRNILILIKKFKKISKKRNKKIEEIEENFYFKIPLFPLFFFFSNIFSIIFVYRKIILFPILLRAYLDFYLGKLGKRL
ncbi:MAG: glycosyltransferase [Patescibacteria group bacterium]|nr:glycosyltransferase [Patescibacteria group bacterium]